MSKTYYGHSAELRINGQVITNISNADLNVNSDDRSMAGRVHSIMEVLKNETTPLTAREISAKYLMEVYPSDPLTTGTICNVLAAAGILIKAQKPRTQRSFYTTFILNRGNK